MEEEPVPQLTRMVDFKLPLYWLITGLVAGLWTLISMWFSLSQLVKTVAELQTTINSNNSSVNLVISETTLLKFRQTAVETELARINEILRNQQRNPK
jgi:hypothetical protein